MKLSKNDLWTPFSSVNFVLACLVFKQSLNFCRWWGDRNEQIYRQYIVYNTQRQSLGKSLRHFVQCAKKALAKLGPQRGTHSYPIKLLVNNTVTQKRVVTESKYYWLHSRCLFLTQNDRKLVHHQNVHSKILVT